MAVLRSLNIAENAAAKSLIGPRYAARIICSCHVQRLLFAIDAKNQAIFCIISDLLRLPWSSYDGKSIRLRQSKTGRRVKVPVGAPLRAVLDATVKRSTIMLTTADGKPWTSDGFRASWGKACKRAGIVGVTFNDLRGTAVTQLALAECTDPEIVTITGHSLRAVNAILDSHYLSRDPALGESAIHKLETKRRTKPPK